VRLRGIVVNICILCIICEAVKTFGSGSTLLRNGGCSGRPFSGRKRSDVGAGRGGPWGANGAIATVTKVHIYPCLQS